jgi:hypothetical protein
MQVTIPFVFYHMRYFKSMNKQLSQFFKHMFDFFNAFLMLPPPCTTLSSVFSRLQRWTKLFKIVLVLTVNQDPKCHSGRLTERKYEQTIVSYL